VADDDSVHRRTRELIASLTSLGHHGIHDLPGMRKAIRNTALPVNVRMQAIHACVNLKYRAIGRSLAGEAVARMS
jgi:hypothetical protein